ncbi:MAG: phosphoglucosamine mutase [Firmicutes bacterium]|nr:phosphoglucosamine mutase [Bacillota bacterium]
MIKYFGTDGIRGKANDFLNAELALKLGRAAASLVEERENKCVLIGKDTRISGDMLESSLAAGLLAAGVDVFLLGVIPTPGVAALCRIYDAPGAVISASHNPYEDNGIKFFSAKGYKLSDNEQDRIEILMNDKLLRQNGLCTGRLYNITDAMQQYSSFLLDKQKPDLSGLKLVIDCANGAASSLAPALLTGLGAQVIALEYEPNGKNINAGCGSTQPQLLQKTVVAEQAQVGLAFDGDADRLLAVDEKGNIVDGDMLLTIMARYLQQKGELDFNTVVVTQMCNMALRLKLQEQNIAVAVSSVGDRYVLEKMQQTGAILGGEQSGHIINSQFNSTGDALAAALFILSIIKDSNYSLSAHTADLQCFHQVHINVPVKNKEGLALDSEIGAVIAHAEEVLAGQGRVLVRASGTEQLLRVMTEGPKQEVLELLSEKISAVIRERLG